MIYPIVLYNNPVLRKRADELPTRTDVAELIDDMFETMHVANGVGLAAPQIGKSIRLFVVDGTSLNEYPELSTFKKVFINPILTPNESDEVKHEEGCLSIPKIREDVVRPDSITIDYYDERWTKRTETFTGFAARIIQHEYDHIEGILFIDHLSPLKKKLLKGKLDDIAKGNVDVDYPITTKTKAHV